MRLDQLAWRGNMKPIKTALTIGCVVALALTLAACRDDEDGRPLAYDKGNYAGKPDTALTDAARRAVQDRIYYQSGVDGTGGGASSGASSSADVRPPGKGDK